MIQSIKMAWKSIAGNKFRAILTMLGIIIGVMALVILVSLVNGATSSVTDQINSLGSNLLTVTISDDKDDPITLEQLDQWMEEEDALGEMAASTSVSATAKYGTSSGSVTVYGVTPSYFETQEMEIYLGRFLKKSDVDNNLNVCVLTQGAASDLVGYEDCVGEVISLNGMKYTVVGIAADNESLTSMMRDSMTAYIPYTSLVRLSTSVNSEITTFYVSAPEGGTMDSAEERMEELLLERFEEDEDAFSISSQSILESAMSSISSILTILLGGIAAISLIVGGIGIMNIMMVTVTERTREIGIRKAIGASRGAILLQFLIEAIMLCMMGCACGIGLSWAILQAVTIVVSDLDITFALNGTVVLIAVVFCFAIGVIFGLYPANKAAKMKPIDALHYGG